MRQKGGEEPGNEASLKLDLFPTPLCTEYCIIVGDDIKLGNSAWAICTYHLHSKFSFNLRKSLSHVMRKGSAVVCVYVSIGDLILL